MGFKLKSLTTNKQKEVEGVWIDVGDGGRLKIARLGNPEYIKERNKLLKGYRSQFIRIGDIPEDVLNVINKKVIAKTILVGWENIQDKDDKLLEYSYENALKVFDDVPDFFALVVELCNDVTRFRCEYIDEAMGNLPKP